MSVVEMTEESTEARPRKPKPSPATQMRRMLMASRRYDVSFETAWSSAWERIRWPHDTQHRLDWKSILEEQRAVWEMAYERQGETSAGLRAAYSLFSREELAA